MKYSYHWLRELTNTKKTPQQLAEMITLKGFELEEIDDLGVKFENFVVGQILDLRKHPQADKLQLVTVDVGPGRSRATGQVIEVVCGAWNIQVGDKVPVALVGAIVPQNKIKVEARPVRGVVSNGMLCAEDELGLGKDHAGIIILDKSAKVGQPLAKALGLDEVVLDFSILPNRAHDCLSHIGFAREVCAMEGRELKETLPDRERKLKAVKKGKQLTVEIKDNKLCPRYIGAVISNVKVGPSPKWMQSRLVASGMEPINNVVDITNYVMLEFGNPLHAFDANMIKDRSQNIKAIIVRRAKKDEKLELLDGKKLELSENDLVITDEEKILALAGIKGGKDSGIGQQTSRIILESANFNSFNIRKTRQRYSLLTESQARYEKGISPVLAEKAAWRAIELLEKYAGATLEELVDVDYSSEKKQTVKLEIESVSRLLGMEIEKEQITRILGNLGFELKGKSSKELTFEVPYWRLDIEGPADLIEEVGRIIGYEKIQETPIVKEVSLAYQNTERQFEWKIKDLLCGLGFDEVINYSFYGEKDTELFKNEAGHLEISNPLTPDQTRMRKTLLPGILRNLADNEKHYDKFSVFEIGRVYTIVNGQPREDLKIAGAVYDISLQNEDIFYHLKGRLEALIEKLVPETELRFARLSHGESSSFNLARTSVLSIGNQLIGAMGETAKAAMKSYGLKRRACMFEIDFLALYQAANQTVRQYMPVRKYPDVKRDISMFVGYKTETSQVIEVIRQAGRDLLLEADLFDIYQDRERNRKSLAFHLIFGAEDRTLTSEEVDAQFQRIVKELEQKLGAEIRK